MAQSKTAAAVHPAVAILSTPGGTIGADTAADVIAAVLPTMRRLYSKDVRGAARGDRGPAVLARYEGRSADGSNWSHRYTLEDMRLLVAYFAARHTRATGAVLTVPAPFGAEAPKAPRTRKTPTKAVARVQATIPVPVIVEATDASA